MAVKQMAGHLIRRLHQASTQVFATRMQHEGFDLTPVQFAALDAIRSAPGSDQAAIAAKIAYDRATIGGVIDRLEKKGLVVRTVSDRDKRARAVTLSDAGDSLFARLQPVVADLQNDILHGLDSTEKAQFLMLATKALAGIDLEKKG
ncbi:MarR family winged helix-turn-helix transcriptional regulator [Aliiroseovarius marinus]|uniref:MarR family winged helix-turn-helix transcriptional regulator n=1 Tax=Aliiroseovarius marinus TaxID=2500159 RepID=UPI0024947BF2|nr:MarR family transcriptional regulator [Aliiroseovarius marinus]